MAEDTRSLRKLMGMHGIPLGQRPLWSYHDHSKEAMCRRVAEAILGGASLAYGSEAGTPMIADPGFGLVQAVREGGGRVIPVPGASAVLAALCAAGLPTDRFLFLGFAPPKRSARQQWLREVEGIAATLVMYESPRRLHEMLEDLVEVFGEEREVAMCRELTKKFEEVRRAPAGLLAAELAGPPPKGECVLVVAPPSRDVVDGPALDAAIRLALRGESVRDASASVAEAFGVPRREVYRRALELAAGPDGPQ